MGHKEASKQKCRDFIKQVQATTASKKEPMEILHQPTDEQLYAARFVKQYLESANQKMFNSYFSSYSDRMFA